MAQIVYDNVVGVYFVPTIADMGAPTSTEITGGTDLTDLMPKDGFNPGSTNNKVNVGHLGTALESEIQGTYGYSLSLSFYRDSEDDVAWDLFPRGTRGYIVYSPFKREPESGDSVSIYKVEAGNPSLPSSAANTSQMFTVDFAVQDANDRAEVAV